MSNKSVCRHPSAFVYYDLSGLPALHGEVKEGGGGQAQVFTLESIGVVHAVCG